jgi:ariadne-1
MSTHIVGGRGGLSPSHFAPIKSGIRLMAAEDLRPEMLSRVQDVAEVLNVPMEVSAMLLRHARWSRDVLLEQYMDHPEKVQKDAGVYYRCTTTTASAPPLPISTKTPSTVVSTRSSSTSLTCPICYDSDFTVNQIYSLPCGHAFCESCWYEYAVNAIQEQGPACVQNTSCPQSRCIEKVTDQDFVRILGEGVDSNNKSMTLSVSNSVKTHPSSQPPLPPPPSSSPLSKYRQFTLRHYVESNPLTRWCPGLGCERVAAAVSAMAAEAEHGVATCDSCTTTFCIWCGADEPHRPVSCKNVLRWKEKCRNESETANWILANTKSCPNCVSRIEKNQGRVDHVKFDLWTNSLVH